MFWFVVGLLLGGVLVGLFMTWVMDTEAQLRYDEGWLDGKKAALYEKD